MNADARMDVPQALARTVDAALRFAPPGHFYSPHPKLEDIERDYENTTRCYRQTPGLDLNVDGQLALLKRAVDMRTVGPWSVERTNETRYFYGNWFFRFGDANALWHMMQLYRPRRVIEVGSGFSTACWLDSGDRLDLPFSLQSIEPYPERVLDLCTPSDLKERVELIQHPVQSLPATFFDALESDDVLFIDSTHIAKSGSDVSYLVFNILPNLKRGVIVHFHDIFWPFEYPKTWYMEGRAWNECFLLRAFLQFNNSFKILRFNSYLASEHGELLEPLDPRFVHDAGASIWIMRV